ncbi:hypothetical protein B0H16DRAFT_1713662 [Mycena metata]|uniref:Uncharacterized protein n=1 Tax=Mycena metata TaxID=1033252 RepID=A0AAD7NTE3_9AGAR|nr:hypothetical protein B0H16DRAFT_1713662 [Mycena metata]
MHGLHCAAAMKLSLCVLKAYRSAIKLEWKSRAYACTFLDLPLGHQATTVYKLYPLGPNGWVSNIQPNSRDATRRDFPGKPLTRRGGIVAHEAATSTNPARRKPATPAKNVEEMYHGPMHCTNLNAFERTKATRYYISAPPWCNVLLCIASAHAGRDSRIGTWNPTAADDGETSHVELAGNSMIPLAPGNHFARTEFLGQIPKTLFSLLRTHTRSRATPLPGQNSDTAKLLGEYQDDIQHSRGLSPGTLQIRTPLRSLQRAKR